jgi:hypothetical protein
MLSNPQKALLKQAQRQAGLSDDEYREVLETVSGCRSSKDPRIGDRHLDKILAYMEAIYFRKVDLGELHHAPGPRATFRQRHFWSQKNNAAETSRDRYMQRDAGERIARLEAEMAEHGCGPEYCAAIRERATKGATDVYALNCYAAALERTLKSKRAKMAAADPF